MAVVATALLAPVLPAASAAPAITMSLGPLEALTYPSNMQSLPDEHTTIIPPSGQIDGVSFLRRE